MKTLFAVEMNRYETYGWLLKNSVESYPIRDGIAPVMKDMARVEQAAAIGDFCSPACQWAFEMNPEQFLKGE